MKASYQIAYLFILHTFIAYKMNIFCILTLFNITFLSSYYNNINFAITEMMTLTSLIF